ncbi:glycine-rich protein 2-like [Cornus florida]|uniref:glycine-rich protein 2-like n=1 Tax=Cornus florida TaxID=4283 RepID=UPI0028A0FB9E|nr:glycine-rich protein 2-like [Cornus florida]
MEEGDSGRMMGVVSSFDDSDGYGTITPDDDVEDLYVHKSNIRGFWSLAVGESVEFLIESGRDRNKAVDVTGPNEERVQGSPGSRGAYGRGGGSRGGGGRDGGRGGNDCFKCGETGHMVRDCYLGWGAGGGGGRSYGGQGGSSGGVGGGNACFKCGKSGHMVSDCYRGGGGGGGGSYGGRGGGRGGGGGYGCFNCGGKGILPEIAGDLILIKGLRCIAKGRPKR